MITQDDIDAFADQNDEPVRAALELARRARKGLPPDRWGSDEEMWQVARGIAALHWTACAALDALQQVAEENRRRQKDAMSVGQP